MNTKEFNKLSNFAKLVELCAVPCYTPRYIYILFFLMERNIDFMLIHVSM